MKFMITSGLYILLNADKIWILNGAPPNFSAVKLFNNKSCSTLICAIFYTSHFAISSVYLMISTGLSSILLEKL